MPCWCGQVTLSTVGYGDISPSDSPIGQLIVMGMIIAAIVVVPVQITTVVDRSDPTELPVL